MSKDAKIFWTVMIILVVGLSWPSPEVEKETWEADGLGLGTKEFEEAYGTSTPTNDNKWIDSNGEYIYESPVIHEDERDVEDIIDDYGIGR